MQPPTKLRAGIIGLGLTFHLLLTLLSQYPAFVERYYSEGLYPILTLIVSNFSGQFFFSLSEFMLWFIVLFGIPFVVTRIRKKRISITRILLNLLTTFAVLYVWFYMSWGLNYFRLPMASKLDLAEQQLAIDAFDSTFVKIIQRANDLNLSYSVKDVPQINAIIEASYEELLPNLGLKKVPGQRGLKTVSLNWVLNKTTTTGWFGPLFHEVHYNRDLLVLELPFVIAHEKAHQMGYTNEAEANFLAHLVCMQSPDPLCQYSGYFKLIGYFINSIGVESRREHYAARLDEGVKLDLAAVSERWRSHRGFISEMSNKGYDLYLRANRVSEGLQSYAGVVDLVVRYYVREGLIPPMQQLGD